MTVAIGVPNGSVSDAGYVRVYEWDGVNLNWIQNGLDIDGEESLDQLGRSVDLSPDGLTVVIGAPWNDEIGDNAGHARVYKLCGSESIDTISACDSYKWINDSIYTTSTNSETFTLANAAGCDSVITLDLTILNSTASTDVQVACDSYTWIDGLIYYASTNSVTDTLANVAGCDSVVTLNLTINTVSASVTQNSTLLTADESGAMYQWLDCPAMTPINSATSQSYTATANGDYAVINDYR